MLLLHTGPLMRTIFCNACFLEGEVTRMDQEFGMSLKGYNVQQLNKNRMTNY